MLENEEMLEEEYDEIITLTDDNGNETDFEYLDTVEYEGDEYVVLVPVSDDENEQLETLILKVTAISDEEDEYEGVEDPEIEMAVFEKFKENSGDLFNFVD